jgi:NitT/TauT family transport system substrate-binding protein
MFRITFILISLFLNGCDFATEEKNDNKQLRFSFAVAPQIASMPWHLANEEGLFKQDKIDIQFVSANYDATIDKFINKEVDAIVISNIDAVAKIVKYNIPADVILITNHSMGNHAIVGSSNNQNKKFIVSHHLACNYLLDRYLIRNQIPFENVEAIKAVKLEKYLSDKTVDGIVAHNPKLYRLTNKLDAKILFDSYKINQEIFDMVLIHRETLNKYPQFGQALLKVWFSIMNRLQGNKKGTTLDALASLAHLSREAYEQQLITTPLNDTAIKALAAIRNNHIRKSMRHLRYFVERHKLTNNKPFIKWISYPGRTPALLHFSGKHLQKFVYVSS